VCLSTLLYQTGLVLGRPYVTVWDLKNVLCVTIGMHVPATVDDCCMCIND